MWDRALLAILYFALDFQNAKSVITVRSAVDSSISCTPDTLPARHGFVHLQSDSHSYPPYFDEAMNYSLFGASVRFQPQYCQWIESTPHWSSIGAARSLTSYTARWENALVSDEAFVDPNYRNWAVTTVPFWSATSDVSIVNFTINSTLFEGAKEYLIHVPTVGDLEGFEKSRYADLGFAYLGMGYFFLSGEGALPKRVAKIQKLNPGVDSDKVADILMSNCKVGDVRIHHEVFAPEKLSVFGYYDGRFITVKKMRDFEIRGVCAGFVSAEELLAPVSATRMRSCVWVQRAIALALLWRFWAPGEDRGRTLRLCFGGFHIAAFRLAIWRGAWLGRDVCRLMASLTSITIRK
jgi:hypothetical protein